MKRKDNNISISNTCWLAKGIVVIFFLFFTEDICAQKIFEKSISSNATNIVVAFNIIDQIELITGSEDGNIVILAESENNYSPGILLEEKKGVVFIKSMENFVEQNALDIDKQCSVQPIYATYRIKIPKNKKIDISFTKGNFYAKNLQGDMSLKVEDGIIKINRFEGSVKVHINAGNVYVNDMINTKVDVRSNLGLVTSDLKMRNTDKSKSHIKGVIGKSMNELNVQAILANIQLKPFKNL